MSRRFFEYDGPEFRSYDELVSYFKGVVLPKDLYRERHHVLPRHQGGEDVESNYVSLPLRYHFLAHYLLSIERPDYEFQNRTAAGLIIGQDCLGKEDLKRIAEAPFPKWVYRLKEKAIKRAGNRRRRLVKKNRRQV